MSKPLCGRVVLGAKTITDDRAEEKRIWRMVRDRGFALDKVRQLYWVTDRRGHPVVGGQDGTSLNEVEDLLKLGGIAG